MDAAEALKRLARYIEQQELLKDGDKVILACSGGADSNAMLYLLSYLRSAMNLSLLAVYVNHQLRGDASEQDQDAVKRLCSSLGVPLIIRRIQIPQQGNLENQARKLRFEAFEQVLTNYQYNKILLAHHRDDQAETVLQNLLRGAGIGGMAGIKPKVGKIVHPMLCFNRKEIEELLISAGIGWQTDASNQDIRFNRNKLRNVTLPQLAAEFNPALKEHLARQAVVFQQADEIMQDNARVQFKRLALEISPQRIGLELQPLIGLKPIERYYLYRLAFRHVSGVENDFMSAHFEEIEDILGSGGSKELYLPHGIRIKKQYHEMIFHTSEEADSTKQVEITIDEDRARAVFGAYRFSFKYIKVLPRIPVEDTDGKLHIIIDADKIKYPFRIRYRQPGDRFMPFGMKQMKRLKEFFIDEKVPKYDRDSVPVMDDGNLLFWIVGYRMDDRVRYDERSTRYLEIHAEPTQEKPKRAANRKKNARGNDESDEL